mmetsp:Transcript_12407/g.29204  ORF Transcript_12407/g.29204 Transcript_12407/m.29204 type:complete len:210 (+) Transcript_12407:407-1036(+)
MKSRYLLSRVRVSACMSASAMKRRHKGIKPANCLHPNMICAMVILLQLGLPLSAGASVRNQKDSWVHASRPADLRMFSSTLEMGMRKSRPSFATTSVRRTMKAVKAAFSKSVSCSSIVLNSTRQPMCPGAEGDFSPSCGGGGFQRKDCQLVDWRFSQWSMASELSRSIRSRKMTSGSLAKRCATCFAKVSSMPGWRSKRSRCSSSYASG